MPSALNYQFQHLTIIPLSDEERQTDTITAEHMGAAVAALHRDGIVALTNAVDLEHIDTLNRILSSEAETMAKLPTTHFNNNSVGGKATGNMSQGPPLEPELMFRDIWANGPAASVIAGLLGPNPHINYVNGNTALGGVNGARQNVHADLTFNHGTFPFAYVANYYLVDTSAANGGTELWLGSHKDTTFEDHKACYKASENWGNAIEHEFGIRNELVEKRRLWAPPIQAEVPRGAVVIRDLRLWHAGIANPTSKPRIMLAFVHTPWWYKCPARVVLPEAARVLVESWKATENPVHYDAHYVPAHLDHTKVAFTPNFSSENQGYNAALPDLPRGYIFE